MGRKLRATVHVGGTTYFPGDEPPPEAAKLITNPAAWATVAAPEQEVRPPAADPAPEPDPGDKRPSGNRRTKN